jgi:hypothetical protein
VIAGRASGALLSGRVGVSHPSDAGAGRGTSRRRRSKYPSRSSRRVPRVHRRNQLSRPRRNLSRLCTLLRTYVTSFDFVERTGYICARAAAIGCSRRPEGGPPENPVKHHSSSPRPGGRRRGATETQPAQRRRPKNRPPRGTAGEGQQPPHHLEGRRPDDQQPAEPRRPPANCNRDAAGQLGRRPARPCGEHVLVKLQVAPAKRLQRMFSSTPAG